MKKVFACLSCVFLLLPIFAGCDSTGDLKPLTPLSDEKKEQITKDYFVYSTLPEDYVTVEEFWKYPGLEYLGSYNGYDVFLDTHYGMMTATVESAVRIAGEEFIYGHPFSLVAYKDGKFQDLEAVYEAGGITKQQIKQIAAYHRSAYSYLYEE